MDFENLSPNMKMLITCVPKRNEAVEWVEEKKRIVLIYPKNFTRFEKFLHRRFGGPDKIRRPLDGKGTFIWNMCDGEHNVHEICAASYNKYHEDIEPVLKRVWGFLETLLKLGLITIERPEVEDELKEGESMEDEDIKKDGLKECEPTKDEQKQDEDLKEDEPKEDADLIEDDENPDKGDENGE